MNYDLLFWLSVSSSPCAFDIGGDFTGVPNNGDTRPPTREWEKESVMAEYETAADPEELPA